MRVKKWLLSPRPFTWFDRISCGSNKARALVPWLGTLLLVIAITLFAGRQAAGATDVMASPAAPAVAAAMQRSVTQVFCASPGDLIYPIVERTFIPYHCISASDCPLRLIEPPLAPAGWNQPGFTPDAAWLGGSRVWWDLWQQPAWQPERVGCGWPIGLQDADGHPLGTNGTTQLYRRVIELVPPKPGMGIRHAMLEMWSDNQSVWWWQGELIASNHQGYGSQTDLVPEHVAPLGGSYVLAIQNSNDLVCSESDYCNPQGTTFRLTVTWAPARTLAYLPLIVRPCQYSTLLVEEFDDAEAFASTDPQRLYVDPELSRAVLALRRSETRYLWRSIPGLASTDFRLTVTGAITASVNNCGLAVALRTGAPTLVRGRPEPESRIISSSNPGVLIGFSYCGADCGNALQNHLHAEWIGMDGQWIGNHEGCRCSYTAGSVIDIAQGTRYVAVLDFRPFLGTATLSVRDESGNLIGEARFPVSVQASQFGVLDTLVLGGSLFKAGGEECAGWIDSVEVVSIKCGP